MGILTNRFSDTSGSTDVYIFQAKYIRNKKINENKLVGGTTTWGPVYEHLCYMCLAVLYHRSRKFYQ